jgi:hypothetical protein
MAAEIACGRLWARAKIFKKIQSRQLKCVWGSVKKRVFNELKSLQSFNPLKTIMDDDL